jgi:mRNA interferase HigB
MRLLNQPLLHAFKQKYADVRQVLDEWQTEVEQAQWLTPQDIKRAYRSADFLADNRVIFNIKGNHYRLVVKVRYQNGIVLIEWIGTHAQYSKKQF